MLSFWNIEGQKGERQQSSIILDTKTSQQGEIPSWKKHLANILNGKIYLDILLT